MRISVLICSRNRAHILGRCIESVLAQDYDRIEILVLDDASEDKEVYHSMINALGNPRIHLLRSKKPLGVSGSRNMLMQQAMGNVFFVIDDDAYLDDQSSLSKVVEIFESKPDVGIIACKVKNHGVAERPYNVPFKLRVLKKNPTIIERGQHVGYFLGTAHAIRREVIDMCGGYNEHLFFGEEELDLSYRAVTKGWKIWYEPSIMVHHVPQPSVVGKRHGYEELYHHVKNRFYLAWRYLPWRYVLPYLVIWLGKYLWDAVQHGFLGGYIKGIIVGLHTLKNTPRESLDKKSLQYLKANFGRLWY